ncbi:hypothetical protein GCM10023191_062650 [Actinoallomurus oryzae]|uniref:Intracellular septation protein A n=2 Tax=Actinoallomurus oryzae TaxID=502180 RepID=A0ABP8QLV2_9ACTN
MSERSVSTVRPVTTQTKGRPMSEHGAPGRSTGEAAPTGGGRLRAVLPSVALNGVVPLLVYLLARPYLPGDAVALALAMAVPVVCTVGAFAWRRRVDAIGAIAVVAYGVALIVVLLSGGDPFVLKLQEAVVTGPLGLVFLLSAAMRRPILLLAARLANRRGSPASAEVERRRRHASTVLTAIMGGTLVVHASALTVLALVLSTTETLALSRLVGLAILGLGLAVLLWYRARLQSAAQAAARAAEETTGR